VQAAPHHERSYERGDNGGCRNGEEGDCKAPAAVDPGDCRSDRGRDHDDWCDGVADDRDYPPEPFHVASIRKLPPDAPILTPATVVEGALLQEVGRGN
jgi:hypothetical protein